MVNIYVQWANQRSYHTYAIHFIQCQCVGTISKTKIIFLLLDRQVPNRDDYLLGPDWVSRFMERHKSELSFRRAGNIAHNRAEVEVGRLKEYFNE